MSVKVSYMLELTEDELKMVSALLAIAASYPGPKNPKSIGAQLEPELYSVLRKVKELMETPE